MNRKQRTILYLAIALFALLLVFYSGYLIYIVKHENQRINEQINNDLENKRKKIENYLKKIENTANDLANDFKNGVVTKQSVLDTLKNRLLNNNDLFEMATIFAPYKYSENQRLYGPYFMKINGKPKLFFAENLNGQENDYTKKIPENKWYNLPIENMHGVWQQPYYDEYTKVLLAEYTTPFYLSKEDEKNKKVAGVISCGIALDYLRKEIQSMDFGKTGYAVLLARDGKIIYHPRKKLVEKLKNINELAEERNNPELQEIADLVTSGKSGQIDYIGIFNNKEMLATVKPFESLGLSMICFCVKDELTTDSEKFRKILFYISFYLVCLLILIWIQLFSTKHWYLSIGVTSICILGVISSLYIYNYFERINDHNKIIINTQAGLNHYIQSYSYKSKTYTDRMPVIQIPTGIFIQSINFSSANDFVVTGYVWQNYKGEYDEETDLVRMFESQTEIKPGIIFPENEEITFTKAYVKKQDESTVIGWYFTGKIRERFEYSEFPFDKEQFWIRMWHEEFDKKIVLVPDFASYSNINPGSLPGIEEDLVLPGWDTISSYFTYVENSYNTNFGISNYVGQYDFPELHFNILVKRKILDKFISHFVPIIIVLFMLFAILMLGRNDGDTGLLGFNSLTSVSACSALFFVVIFNHINLRKELCVPGIVYMEYFYFVTYLVLLFVSVNSIVLVFCKNHKFFYYGDNLVSRLIFWPVTTVIIYILTFIKFI